MTSYSYGDKMQKDVVLMNLSSNCEEQQKQDFSGAQKGHNTSAFNIQTDLVVINHHLLTLFSYASKENCLKN